MATGGRHHPDHHHRPDMANTYANSMALLRRVCLGTARFPSGRDHAKPAHVHAAHVHVVSEPKHIAPRESNDGTPSAPATIKRSRRSTSSECCRSFIRKVAGGAEGYLTKITPDWTTGSEHSGRSCPNYPTHAVIAKRIPAAPTHGRAPIFQGSTAWPVFADISPLGCMVGSGSTDKCRMPGISADRFLPSIRNVIGTLSSRGSCRSAARTPPSACRCTCEDRPQRFSLLVVSALVDIGSDAQFPSAIGPGVWIASATLSPSSAMPHLLLSM